MSNHKFHVGQTVCFLSPSLERNVPTAVYIITKNAKA